MRKTSIASLHPDMITEPLFIDLVSKSFLFKRGEQKAFIIKDYENNASTKDSIQSIGSKIDGI